MTKQFISIVEILSLHDILIETKSFVSVKILNYLNTETFLSEINSKNLAIILVEENPIKIGPLLDKINILLIKKKYDFQSQLIIKNYTLNLNSRIISSQEYNLKLTEREIDIILFLKENDHPQSVNNLQNEVWKYSNILETHTVETHIYRLRKKIKDKFSDDNFILSLKEGYKI